MMKSIDNVWVIQILCINEQMGIWGFINMIKEKKGSFGPKRPRPLVTIPFLNGRSITNKSVPFNYLL